MRILIRQVSKASVFMTGFLTGREGGESFLFFFYLTYSHFILDATGLKYTLDLLQPKGQRIQKAKLLGFYCDWKPLNENESYMIMTNNNIANTLFSSVPKHNKTPSKRGETEALFFYAISVCNVKSNWHRMRLHHDPKQIPLPSDMILDSSTTCSERTTSATV